MVVGREDSLVLLKHYQGKKEKGNFYYVVYVVEVEGGVELGFSAMGRSSVVRRDVGDVGVVCRTGFGRRKNGEDNAANYVGRVGHCRIARFEAVYVVVRFLSALSVGQDSMVGDL